MVFVKNRMKHVFVNIGLVPEGDLQGRYGLHFANNKVSGTSIKKLCLAYRL